MKILIHNSRDDQALSDWFDHESFRTSGGILYSLDGHPVKPERAVSADDVSFAPDFEFPEMRNRGAVTNFLESIKIPRGAVYSKLYSQLASKIPEGKLPKYEKPAHT